MGKKLAAKETMPANPVAAVSDRRKSDDNKRRSETAATVPAGKPSALLDTRVIYCGDNLEQLRKLPVHEILDEEIARKLA
ncbi:MAG: hypothetical protein NT105_18055 [Verrucomicrobia bacterium]|nr:hypothetical protein [Verrucomicrobiota bacterium]